MHLMTTNRPFGPLAGMIVMVMIVGIIIIIIVARTSNKCRQHFWNLLNMDLGQRRPSYDHKSSFWPLAGMIMMVMTVVRARNYNNNYCGARL